MLALTCAVALIAAHALLHGVARTGVRVCKQILAMALMGLVAQQWWALVWGEAVSSSWRVGGTGAMLCAEALLYLQLPLDVIPDGIPIFGRLDDAAVIALGLLGCGLAVFAASVPRPSPPTHHHHRHSPPLSSSSERVCARRYTDPGLRGEVLESVASGAPRMLSSLGGASAPADGEGGKVGDGGAEDPAAEEDGGGPADGAPDGKGLIERVRCPRPAARRPRFTWQARSYSLG